MTSTTTISTTATESAPTPVAVAPNRTYSLLAFVLAIGSLALGQTVVLPIVAIVLGIMGYRQEPAGRTLSVWGIVLAAFALFGWVLFGAVGLAIAAPFALLGLF